MMRCFSVNTGFIQEKRCWPWKLFIKILQFQTKALYPSILWQFVRDKMMSEWLQPFLDFSTFIVDARVRIDFRNEEHHLRPPFEQRYNDHPNHARLGNMNGEPPQQSTAVKASTAWPISHIWDIEIGFPCEEDDDADCIAGFDWIILLDVWHFRQVLLHPIGCKNGCHFPCRQTSNNISLSSYNVGKDSRMLLSHIAISTNFV